MARKPRDYDAELQALMDKARKVRTQKTTQLGELVQIIGADALPMEALAGALLAVAGKAVFQSGGKRGKKAVPGDAASGAAGNTGAAPAPDRAPD